MYVHGTSANSLNLRRNNIESERSDQEKSAANASATELHTVQQLSDASSSGQVLQFIGDKASEDWRYANPYSIELISREDLADLAAERATDERAEDLFTSVDTKNPTLVTNVAGFNVNASQGPNNSTYIDLGNGAAVFVFNQSSGEQVIYQVDEGELGERLTEDGKINIGNDIYVSVGESASGESEINFQQGRRSFTNWRPETMILNSDNSMLTIKDPQGGFLGFFRGTDVDSFDIQSGQQLVSNGKADVDKMSPQQQFDYYADTRQGAQILNVEGNFYQSAVEKRLLVARAQYMRGEGGPELFNEFTPRRATLTGDDLVAYDASVEDMMNEIREQGTYTQGVEGSDTVADLDTPLNESMLYIIASSAVEAYGDSPEAMEAIQEDLSTWKISTDNADGVEVVTATRTSFSAGWYNGSTGTVQFNIDSLVNDFTRPDDQFELVTHELAHSLDNVDQTRPGFLDGIPPNLSTADTEMLIAERERMFELAYPGEDADSSINQDHNTVVDNSGFRDYTFRNRKEFWAELSSTFLGSDARAEIVKKASPELYNIMREYFNRDDLPEA